MEKYRHHRKTGPGRMPPRRHTEGPNHHERYALSLARIAPNWKERLIATYEWIRKNREAAGRPAVLMAPSDAAALFG